MTQERLNDVITAWQKISDACAASTNIDWILKESKEARSFYCFEVEESEVGISYWLNVDDIICVEVFRAKGEEEWRVSRNIGIVDPKTND